MRIRRKRSARLFARRRQPAGCSTLALLLGIAIGALIGSWRWIEPRLNVTAGPTPDLRRANQAFARGDLEQAVNIARQGWAARPGDGTALGLLVRALVYRSYADYRFEGDLEEAVRVAREAALLYPTNLEIQAAYAFALQANGQAVEAASVAGAVLAREPDHPLARIARGLAYGRVGGYENAFQALSRFDAGEFELDRRRALAITLSDLGRYQEALEMVTVLVGEHRRLLTLYYEQALYALQLGDTDTATAAYFRVLAFDPGNAKARLRMCELSSQLRERERAIRYCREATETAPSWVAAWHGLGRQYFLAGNFSGAQSAFGECTTLSIRQNVPIGERLLDCWYLQGQAAEILGDCENLLLIYTSFTAMVRAADLPQTWVYPPEGPSICLNPPPQSPDDPG